jgi:iron complex outermembrane receptor protein
MWTLGPCSAAVLLMATSFGIQAATTASEDNFELGEVLVSAHTRSDEMIGGARIDAGSMRQLDKRTLDQALELVSGTNAANTGGSRNERLIYIRGFDRFQTTLSIDGVRVYLPADNRIDFGRFLTSDLSQIQVSKGYVSVLDGPGALGGAINLVTRRPAAALEAEFNAQDALDGDGSYAGHTVSGRVGTRQQNFYLQASGVSARQDHWRLSHDFVPTSLEDGGERNHSDSRDYRYNLKAGYVPNATDEYALNYTRQSGEKDAPYHTTDTASTRFWAWPYWDLDSLYFLSVTQFGANIRLRTGVYLNSFENALYSYDNAAQSSQSLPRAFRSFYDDTAWGARIGLDVGLSAENTLRSALHYRRDQHVEWQEGFVRVPATGNPFTNQPYTEPRQTTEEDTWSLAIEDTQLLGAKVDLVTGLSYDWTDLRRAEDLSVFVTGSTINQVPVLYPLRNAHALNAQAALSFQWRADTRLHASVSSRARFPTLFERFSSRMGTAVPNPDIGPERAINYELGSNTKFASGLAIEAAVFFSQVEDALLSVPVVFGTPISATLNQTRNVGNGHYHGAELSIDAPLGGVLSLGGNYSYTARTLHDPTNAAFRPTGVPTQRLLVHADWHPLPAWSIAPSAEVASQRWTVTSSSSITPPRYYRTGSYVLANLAMNWSASEHFDLQLGARNLFDRNYQLVDGFPEAGRSYYLELRARLSD